jgi:hypothetical protein
MGLDHLRRWVVWVDPSAVSHKYNFKHNIRWQLEELGVMKRRLRIPSASFGKVRPISENEKYRRLENLVLCGDSFRETDWYQDLHKEWSARGFVVHKQMVFKSEPDLDAFFKGYLLPLIDSLKNKGYDRTIGDDLGAVVVGSDGQWLKGPHATHRFYLSKILGIKKFPLFLAGVHQNWVEKCSLKSSADAEIFDHVVQKGLQSGWVLNED